MASFENSVVVAKNLNFDIDAAKPHLGIIDAAGKLPIGTGNSYPIPEILGGSITSPGGSITVGYSSPNITIDVAGGGTSIEQVTVDNSTVPGTNPVLPSGGNITITGGQIINSSLANVIQTHSLAANSFEIQIQRSAAVAAADTTKNGVAHFDSASFAVASTGFVTLTGGGGFTWNDVSGAFSPLKNNGYFITGTATGTLPASPSQGDTIKFFVDHATQFLTIDAPGTQIIRFGNNVSSAGGTFVSTAQGDSVELVYRASDTCWCAVAGYTGTWTFT